MGAERVGLSVWKCYVALTRVVEALRHLRVAVEELDVPVGAGKGVGVLEELDVVEVDAPAGVNSGEGGVQACVRKELERTRGEAWKLC